MIVFGTRLLDDVYTNVILQIRSVSKKKRVRTQYCFATIYSNEHATCKDDTTFF